MKQLKLKLKNGRHYKSGNLNQKSLVAGTLKKGFGGDLMLGKRKTKRPLSTTQPIHLVLKSDHKFIFNCRNVTLIRLIDQQA